MNPKIYVVEDDESIRHLIEFALRSQSYDAIGFSDAVEAMSAMERTVPDVVIMDIMMDGMDGVEAVRRMRENEQLAAVPVILLTAKDMEIDKITGLDAGADDYMTKPFSVLELCARVRVQLRHRGGSEKKEQTYLTSGGLVLDIEKREVKVDGKVVPLTYKEFELLKILMQNAGKSVPRQALLEKVWGTDFSGESRTLDMHIGTLRQKIGDAPELSRYIKTVRGVGYRFVGGEV